MIGTVAVVLTFVVLGLGVVFIALSGGPQGARKNLDPQTRGWRRVMMVGTGVVIAAFGVGIPAAVIAANNSSQSKQSSGGVKLTAAQEDGRKVFAKNCSTCHTLSSANAVGKVGPSLDAIRPPAALVVNAVQMGRARGSGQMPAGLVDGAELKELASYVAATAGR